jgi:tyrosine-specific transport protein
MKTHHPSEAGSVLGGILLISGCCIGAGMLGMPVLSALAGFEPSLVMFLISWMMMTCSALFLLEVNLWFADEVSLISMADRTLGFAGKIIAWVCFLFLFYTLGVAYIAGSGELITAFVRGFSPIDLPNWIGSLFLSTLFGVLVYLGTKAVDLFNRFLMLGLIVSYVLLVGMGHSHVNLDYLKYRDWSEAVFVLPVMIISFGFHNLVPSLTTYLKRNRNRLRLTIIIGSTIPLIIYIIWEWLILGLVPIEGESGFRYALDQGQMATQALKNAVGIPWVADIAQYFAFFAIVTSFLGNSLSFVDFLADGLQIKKERAGKIFLCLLVILPSLVFALLYPKIFLTALNYAGAFGAVTLFVILPALMVWAGRYWQQLNQNNLVPGGRLTLVILILFSFAVIAVQFIDLFS